MGEVAVGDLLLDADGRPTTVTGATGVMTGRPCFEVVFSDGTRVVADAEHQWLTSTRASRRGKGGVPAIRTTAQIAATVRCATADARANHSVANAAPLQLPEADLPLPPYALGAWLGDGHSAGARLTTADPEMVMHLEAEGLVVTAQAGTPALRAGAAGRPPSPRGPASCAGRAFVPATSQVRTCGRRCGGRARLVSSPVPPPTCRGLR